MAIFTTQGAGRWLKILTVGKISAAKTRLTPDPKQFVSNSVQWDTGSMVTCISERLVAELGLQKSGVTTISGIENKPRKANTYMVDLMFPNGMEMSFRQVVEAPMPFVDVLVGMDVISECDFHYEIVDGKSKITVETHE